MHLNLNRLDKPFLLNPQYIDKDPHESSHLQRHNRETTQRLLWTKKCSEVQVMVAYLLGCFGSLRDV